MLLRRLTNSFGLVVCIGSLFFVWTLLTLWWCSCETMDSGFIMDATHDESEQKKDMFMAILILTGPLDRSRRDLIRETWLNGVMESRSRVFHYFPVGVLGLTGDARMNLHVEQTKHGDLVLLEGHKETYANLTGKVLESFVAISDVARFRYLLKVDDDSFVRVGPLVDRLENIGTSRLYYGFLDGRAHVKQRGKWLEQNWNLCDRYLPYALGGGYVLGWELVGFFIRNRQLLKLYSSEDVSVGAWLAGLDVNYVHEPKFDTEYKSRGCLNDYLITHKQNETEIRRKWANLRATGMLCPEEFRTRRSYLYNWAVPPSQCCNRTRDKNVP